MKRLVRSPYFWGLLIGCVTVTLIRPLLRREPAAPPVLRSVPRFELIAADGTVFGSDALRGHVYVATFFSTRCAAIAMPAMQAMATLQRRYRDAGIDAIRLVSIAADPAFDTPERLHAAQPAFGVDPARWVLLTGGIEEIRSLAAQGFHLPLGDAAAACDADHPSPLMLVDPQGGLRGIYGTGDAGIDEVFWRSRHVLREAQER
jgi:protein SCO1/2